MRPQTCSHAHCPHDIRIVHTQSRRLFELNEIPAVAPGIKEHRHFALRLIARRFLEGHTGRGIGSIIAVEIVGG